MDWLILTVLAVSSRGLYSIASKLFNRTAKVSAITQAVSFSLCATVLTLLVSPFIVGISFNGILAVWPIAVLMIFSQVFNNVLYFKGMETLDAGSTQIAFSSVLIWGTLLSVMFLGSHFSLEQIAGMFIVMFAIIFNAYRKSHRKFGIGVLYIILCALLGAVFQVTSARLALTISTGGYLIMAYLFSAIIISAAYPKKVFSETRKIKETVPVLGALLFSGATSLGYLVLAYLAYGAAPSRGVVVLLLATQVIASVLLGVILLRERDHIGRKLLAAIIVVIGAVLINS